MSKPSEWVVRHAPQITESGQVLDLACGSGRHARYLLSKGFHVTCLDIDLTSVLDLEANPNCQLIQADLEGKSDWPFAGIEGTSISGTRDKCSRKVFDGIIVSNYLYRPLFEDLVRTLSGGGVLIYQTFMVGNEKYGRPRNPDHLLETDELKVFFEDRLDIIEFRQGFSAESGPAMVQQICAVKQP